MIRNEHLVAMSIINWFQVDPALPALALSFDTNAIAQLFTERWASVTTTEPCAAVVHNCRLQEIHYQPAMHCIGTYELNLQGPDRTLHSTIGVVEVRPEGYRSRLYIQDERLPWLTAASDPQVIQARLQPFFPDLHATQVTPVRYKPGSRCVLRYQLEHATHQTVLFGKLLAQDSADLCNTFRLLAQAGRGNPHLPRVAQVVAYWDDWQMLVQSAVDGVELHQFAFDGAVSSALRQVWFRRVGEALAALHSCTTLPGPSRTLATDLRELHEYQRLMARINPHLASRYATAVAHLDHLAQRCSEPRPVPSHGALRTDQFLLAQDPLAARPTTQAQLVMIDLDSFCWANPARDLGNFLAYLGWKAIRQPQFAAFIALAQQGFCQAYRATGVVFEQGWLAIYQALSMLKIMGRRFRSLSYQEWPFTERLLNTAHDLLLSAG